MSTEMQDKEAIANLACRWAEDCLASLQKARQLRYSRLNPTSPNTSGEPLSASQDQVEHQPPIPSVRKD
jgi:hypothetical protein